MTYEDWEKTVPPAIAGDSLWKRERIGYHCLPLISLGKMPLSLCVIAALEDCRTNYIVPSARSVLILPKATRAERGEIEHASTNMVLVRQERGAIGITKEGTSWVNLSPLIVWI